MQMSNVSKVLAGTATSGLVSKVRLWIEYGLLVLVLVLCGLFAWQKYRAAKLETSVATLEGKLSSAEERVTAVETINAQQAEAIETVRSIRDVDGTILAGLVRDLDALRVRDSGMTNRIATLEKSNEAVKKYLNSAVPEPLGCVLDKTCTDQDGRAAPQAERRPAGVVPAAKAAPKQDKR